MVDILLSPTTTPTLPSMDHFSHFYGSSFHSSGTLPLLDIPLLASSQGHNFINHQVSWSTDLPRCIISTTSILPSIVSYTATSSFLLVWWSSKSRETPRYLANLILPAYICILRTPKYVTDGFQVYQVWLCSIQAHLAQLFSDLGGSTCHLLQHKPRLRPF